MPKRRNSPDVARRNFLKGCSGFAASPLASAVPGTVMGCLQCGHFPRLPDIQRFRCRFELDLHDLIAMRAAHAMTDGLRRDRVSLTARGAHELEGTVCHFLSEIPR